MRLWRSVKWNCSNDSKMFVLLMLCRRSRYWEKASDRPPQTPGVEVKLHLGVDVFGLGKEGEVLVIGRLLILLGMEIERS